MADIGSTNKTRNVGLCKLFDCLYDLFDYIYIQVHNKEQFGGRTQSVVLS